MCLWSEIRRTSGLNSIPPPTVGDLATYYSNVNAYQPGINGIRASRSVGMALGTDWKANSNLIIYEFNISAPTDVPRTSG